MGKRNPVLTAVISILCILVFSLADYAQVEAVNLYDCDSGKHQYSVTIEKDTSIEEAGIRVYVCELCGNRYEEEIPKLGHNYGEWIVETKADCVQEGLRYRVCKDEIHVDEVREEEILPAGAHNYVQDTDKSLLATCEAEGILISICSGCGREREEVIGAAGHAYGEWEIRKKATLFEEGLKVRVCRNDPEHMEEVILEKGIRNLTVMDRIMVATNTTNLMVFFLLIRYDYTVILWNRRKLRKLLVRRLKT